MAGARAYDEGKTAVLAGLAASAGLLLTQARLLFSSASEPTGSSMQGAMQQASREQCMHNMQCKWDFAAQGVGVFASYSTWVWGIALPMAVTGIATHYLTWLRGLWSQYWQQAEASRCLLPQNARHLP